MFNDGFNRPIDAGLADALRARALRGRGATLTATTLANSGHPGGSFSSMEIYTLLASCARLRPSEPRWPGRDRLVVSHGHTSPGMYSALASAGFFPIEEFEAHFRQAGSPFEGHVERMVPGVEWSTGNLGQGLSVGVGFALASRMTGGGWHTFVAMSDGEQHKGQVAEARRLAVAQGLRDITAIIDLNGIQISGHTSAVMPVNVADDWRADGWTVVEVDGHDIEALYAAIAGSVGQKGAPTCVVADTTIGKGVSFMEDQAEFHGRGLTAEEYWRAMGELGLESDLDAMRARRAQPCTVEPLPVETPPLTIASGTPRSLASSEKADCRGAWGKALVDLAQANPELPIAVLDCDLAVSVKTDGFSAARPSGFVQCGVGEHNAATVGGALSTQGVLAFWSDFGVFGIDEVYNQQRLNDVNGAALKLAVTHCGLDVGEDGRTHQCLDYVGALRNFFGWKVIVPADANQTDRAVRAAAAMQGCVALAMGRSKLPVIDDGAGGTLFGDGYEFRYGEIVWAREGSDACILTMGTVAGAAVAAADALKAEGVTVAVGIVACPLDLDEAALWSASSAPVIFSVEDHGVRTGLGASIAEWLAEKGAATPLVRLGVKRYSSSGAAADLFRAAGLDTEGIARSVRASLAG